MKERFNAVEAYEKDYVFKVKSQATNDSPFAFPVEGVALARIPLIDKGCDGPDGVVPVAILEGRLFEAVDSLVGSFVDVEVPNALAACLSTKSRLKAIPQDLRRSLRRSSSDRGISVKPAALCLSSTIWRPRPRPKGFRASMRPEVMMLASA
ncbi:hypothetical protein AB0N24_04840 [Arthrobacter sp. NPDC093128]|uniref:hypothetical protein n=1 Tax=Arthrobacter sp. NPDC093128 TaxID=3154979 RepID=UPI0034355210